MLSQKGLIGDPPIHYNTLLCIVKEEQLLAFGNKRRDVRTSFETDHVNCLWIGDFMHGPLVDYKPENAQGHIMCDYR